jgi:hypothetical protein
MDIKIAKPSDLIELVYLSKVCSFEMNSIQFFFINYFNKYISPLILQNDVYVCRLNECSVGLLAINYPEIEENSNVKWTDNSGKFMTTHILVHPKWKESNIYNNLLDFAENTAKEKGYLSIRIYASADNLISLEALKNKDFQKAGEFKILYFNNSFVCFEKII